MRIAEVWGAPQREVDLDDDHWLAGEDLHRIPRLKVRPDGGVFLCEGLDLVLGNLRDRTPEEIWRSPERETFRDRFTRSGGLPICGRCCRGVVGPARAGGAPG